MTEIVRADSDSAASPRAVVTDSFSRAFLWAASGALMLLSGFVWLGWHWGRLRMTTLIASSPPMAPNTAYLFILSAIALICCVQQQRRAARFCAATISVWGAITLIQYPIGRSLGIDRLLWWSTAPEIVIPIGRMSPNTAACFVLGGLALLAMSARRAWPRSMITLASMILGVVLLPLCGYATELALAYSWGHNSGMSLPTATGFLLIAASLIVWVWRTYGLPALTLPLTAAAAVVMLSVGTVAIESDRAMVEANAWVAHTFKVREHLNQVLLDLADADAADRSLYTTGDNRFRADFARVRQAAEENVAGISLLVSDNRLQADRWPGLRDALRVKFDFIAADMAAYGGSPDHAWRVAQVTRAAELSQDVRQRVELMLEEEQRLLALRETASEATKLQTERLVVLGGSLAMALVTLALLLARRSEQAWRKAERHVREANQQLEERVAVRTADLARVNAELRASEQSFRFLADAMPQIVWTATPDGRLDYHNAQWREYTGLTFEQTKDWGWRTVLHPEDVEACVRAWSHSFGSGVNLQVEYRLRRAKDGTYRWHLGRAYPQRDTTGRTLRWVGTCTDIHDQKAAAEVLERQVAARTAELAASEERYREKEAFLQSIFTGVDLVIVMVDVTHDGDFRFAALNPAAERQTGLRSADWLGRSVDDLIGVRTPEDVKAMKERYRACMEHGGRVEFEAMVNTPEGPKWWVERLTPLRDSADRVHRIIASSLEITERKQLELNLAQARDQALEASRLKSEFLATMSHEIRTPMNGIIGMSGLLLDTTLTPEQREMGQVIARSADTLLTLINDILDFSKIEAGKLRIELADFDLREIIEETVALLAPQAHKKGIELICDIDSIFSSWLHGDAARIQQVVTNLLGNAIKFTSRGEVVVAVRGRRTTDDRIHLRIEIRDTGIGIPEAARAKLFAPFTQADGSTTRRFGGTGLGLAICRQLVRLMDGELSYDSKEGVGSIFWFELTLAGAHAAPTEIQEALPAGVRLLVVDDNEANRAIFLRQLGVMGGSADAVDRASEALAALNQQFERGQPYDLVLLDGHMPEVDGLALAKLIRADERFTKLPLVMLTSAITFASDDPALPLFAAVLTKPVRHAQLQRCLLRVFGRVHSAAPFTAVEELASKSESDRGLRLLVAEDNPSNQLVARMMLERMGHTMEVANNGAEALRLLEHSKYDAILMDCQMPELDGYETTRRIRAGKVPGLSPRIPIVALTAYAMAGDRARCLAAGMDDYVTKPLSMDDLRVALSRCGLTVTRETREAPAPSMASVAAETDFTSPVLDPSQLAQLRAIPGLNGASLADEVIALFLRETPNRIQTIMTSAEARQAKPLAQVAHVLAGSCANVGAVALRKAAMIIEASAREEAWAQMPPRLQGLQQAWLALQKELAPARA